MSDELKIQTSALAEYVCDGNDALEFKLVGVIFDAVFNACGWWYAFIILYMLLIVGEKC